MDILIQVLSGLCLLIGSFLMLSGALGVLRFPDLYTRMHAAGVTDTLAATLVVVGLLLLSGWSLVSAKLIMILVFLMFSGPTSSHALAKAASNKGLVPWRLKPDTANPEGGA